MLVNRLTTQNKSKNVIFDFVASLQDFLFHGFKNKHLNSLSFPDPFLPAFVNLSRCRNILSIIKNSFFLDTILSTDMKFCYVCYNYISNKSNIYKHLF